MDFIIRIIIISLIVISIILVNNRRKINLFFEKEFILKLLLFAVCLFIKTKKNKNISLKSKFSKFLSDKLLVIDLWVLKLRTSNKRKEHIYIRSDKKPPKNPNC